MRAIARFIKTTLFLAAMVIGGAVGYAYSGWYDMSVGSGHTSVVQWYLNTLRQNSIESAAAEIQVPVLTTPGMFEAGAKAYDRGCAGCHGRPARAPSSSWEPAPPALTRYSWDPAELFWVVRNGIKMSAMPSIDAERIPDAQVWEIAAFLQDSASLTEGEYRELVEPPPEPEPAPEPEAEPGAEVETDAEAESEPEAAENPPTSDEASEPPAS